MSNYESDLSVEKIFSPRELSGPCVVSDKDTETLEWIHGDSDVRFKVDIKMCFSDVGYLLEHIFLNLINLMLDRDKL